MDTLTRLWPGQVDGDDAGPGTTVLVATTVVATTAAIFLLRHTLWPAMPKILKSPLHTVLPKLSPTEKQALDYKPDAFPGARDVRTPYGSTRVYEWGPEDGPKVLMIHGISTSSQTLGPIANSLVVAKGCRVMVFDLFGRGFSDGVGDLPHDARLYVSQTLLCLASSSLPWTGDKAFRLVGYSMGGGIAVHFAASFPHLISSLVLLAPAGLVRLSNLNPVTRWVFTSGFVPERLLAHMTKRTLRKPLAAGIKKKPVGAVAPDAPDPGHEKFNCSPPNSSRSGGPRTTVKAALAEAADPSPDSVIMPLEARVLRYVRWQLDNHPGFVPAFMSCVRHAPLTDQHDVYKNLRDALQRTPVAVIMGRSDEVVNPEDYEVDAKPLLNGMESLVWEIVDGGHDFPMTHARETLEVMERMWGMN